jgi:multicomponent Na+:H+ antiporter subunit G
MNVYLTASVILILSGVFLIGVSIIGILRLPDFYCRTHATGKSDTLGMFLVLAGIAVFSGISLVSLKIMLIALFIMIANPTATNAISRAAFLSGLQPWLKKDKVEKK